MVKDNLELIELTEDADTRVGNYFVSNYPPYSFWTPDLAAEAIAALDRPPLPNTPLGVYLHIPFCRRRCHFCYFRVYTDKNAAEIKRYSRCRDCRTDSLYPKAVSGRTQAVVRVFRRRNALVSLHARN